MTYKKIVYFLVFCILFMSLFLPERVIKINSIECRSQNGNCHVSISEGLEKFEQLSLFAAKKNISHYLDRDARAKEYRMQYKLPDRILVDIIEKTGKFAISHSGSKDFYVVDTEGYVIEKSESTKLPFIIVGDEQFEIGLRVNDREISALKLVSEVYNIFGTEKGVLDGDSLVIELDNGLNVILPVSGDTELLIGSLILVTGRLNEAELNNLPKTAFTTLDLRFGNPILR